MIHQNSTYYPSESQTFSQELNPPLAKEESHSEVRIKVETF